MHPIHAWALSVCHTQSITLSSELKLRARHTHIFNPWIQYPLPVFSHSYIRTEYYTVMVTGRQNPGAQPYISPPPMQRVLAEKATKPNSADAMSHNEVSDDLDHVKKGSIKDVPHTPMTFAYIGTYFCERQPISQSGSLSLCPPEYVRQPRMI